jgi:DNA-binding SARP family transcriptional activator
VPHIRTLGGLSVLDGDRPLAGAAKQPKRLALLALLARAGSKGVSRDRLLLMLWPDADEERARRGLNQALYALRQDLGESAIAGSNDLRLDPDHVSSDVQQFAAARADGRPEAAAALWGGAFLDGFALPGFPEFERWAETERQALSHDYAGLLEELATAASRRGEPVAAVGWWRKLAALDPHNARVAEALMRALAAAGDTPGALRHAEIFNALLDADLGLPPDRQVAAAAERIRAEAMRAVPGAPPAPAPSPGAPSRATEAPVAPASPPDAGASPSRDAPAQPLHAGADPLTVTTGWAAMQAPPATAPSSRAAAASVPTPPGPASGLPAGPAVAPAHETPVRRRWRTGRLVAVALVAVAGLALAWSRLARAPAGAAAVEPRHGGATVIAVGRIADYTRAPGGDRSAPLADMLATNLARARGLEVVGTSRIYELVAQLRREGDTTAGAVARAARLAGAAQVVDGALYEVSPGRLRLDLRRVDVATGSVRSAHAIEGTDLFALADSGTRRLSEELGGEAPSGPLAGVTTSSEAAYRLYDAGLRAFSRGERATARRLFESALREDSAFAMAQYYLSETTDDIVARYGALDRARRLSDRASPREGLMIRAAAGFVRDEPGFRAVAETLSIRFPQEIDGHYWFGQALVRNREYAAARAPLERAIAMDSLGLAGRAARCVGCEAYAGLVFALVALDSFPAAERVARRWVAAQPDAIAPHRQLAEVLTLAGRDAEARGALAEAARLGLADHERVLQAAAIEAYAERYAAADSILRPRLGDGSAADRWDTAFNLALWLRAGGRFADALAVTDVARRAFRGEPSEQPGARGALLQRGQVLFDMGRHAEAIAAWDSVGRYVDARETEPTRRRSLVSALLLQARAHAALRDTARLAPLADSIAALTRMPGMERTGPMAEYPRGLLLLARGDTARAIAAFRAIPVPSIVGFVPRDVALAEALVGAGRAREAVAVLQPNFRAYRGAAGTYATRTDLHEALALAWEAAGRADSARAHWAAVVRAWEGGDAVLAARVGRARGRLGGRDVGT